MIDHETKRLSRLIALLTLLQTKRLFTAPELATRFSVSIRTIYRDIRSLEAAGVPVITDEGRGYTLMEGYRLPPVMFTEAEANALITAEPFILRDTDASFPKEYTEAINKIKAALQSTTRDKVNLLSSRIKVYPAVQPVQTSNYLSVLQHALTNYYLVQIDYANAAADQTCRIIEPFALLNTQQNWLLVAWCRLRKTYRIFRLDRIKSLTTLRETFQPHELTLKDYFEQYGR